MYQQGKNPGYGNRGKTNRVFPPFPQPLLLLTYQDQSSRTKTTDDRLHKTFDATRLEENRRNQALLIYLVAVWL
jgi:hypothetical protein